MILLSKLRRELIAVNLPGWCATNGRVDFVDGTSWSPGQAPRNPQEELAAQIVAAHDPTPLYDELRRKEYPTTDELIVALWERIVEGRNEASDTLQAKREVIKAKYPKP